MDNRILRFDIETCPEVTTEVEWATYPKRQCWEKKAETNPEIDGSFKSYLKKAWIYPEFSKVVCVSFKVDDHVNTIISQNERAVLSPAFEVFRSWNGKLGWFNIYNFDIPFLRKRGIINGFQPPMKLCIADMKPREMWDNIVDVMQIWKQTSFACSLDLLSQTLLWDSPKSDGAGDMVASAWKSENYDWIKKYCEWDVDFTIRCYDKIMNPVVVKEEDMVVPVQEWAELTSPFSSDTWDEPVELKEDDWQITVADIERTIDAIKWKNEVSEEQIKAFDEWIEERKAEAKAEAERKMSEPIEQWPLPF